MSGYSGACWNAIMEEESKESLARLYIDSMRAKQKEKEHADSIILRLVDQRDQFRVALEYVDGWAKGASQGFFGDMQTGLATMQGVVSNALGEKSSTNRPQDAASD